MSAKNPGAALGDASGNAARAAAELIVAVDIGYSGDVVSAQRAVQAAGREGNWKHHRFRADDPAAARAHLRFAER